MDKNRSSPEVYGGRNEPAFERQRLLASGRLDALRFAWQTRYDLSLLQTEIRKTEERISIAKGAMSPGAGPRIYKDGYLTGLRDAMKILGTGAGEFRSGVRIEALSALLYQMLLADGRIDAFDLAWKTRGDLALLQARIHDIEEMISNPPESLKDVLQPGVGSRIYLEGYLVGLGDIIEIVSKGQPSLFCGGA